MSQYPLIFADNNATTPVAPEVVAAMQPFFGPEFFNPSSMYEPALKVAGALKAARKTVAAFLGGVEPSEVLFTSARRRATTRRFSAWRRQIRSASTS